MTNHTSLPIAGKSILDAKMWPNGEFVVWKKRFKGFGRLKRKRSKAKQEYGLAFNWLKRQPGNEAGCSLLDEVIKAAPECFGSVIKARSVCEEVERGALPLRLVSPPYLRQASGAVELGCLPPAPRMRSQRGRRGISSQAARKVRNVAYLLEKDKGRRNLSFLTFTLPQFENSEMDVIHVQWNSVVDSVRRKISRILAENKISSEIIVVSEVQEDRFKQTGLPVLHLHIIFQGRKPFAHWVMSVARSQEIWEESLSIVLGRKVCGLAASSRIEPVRKSVSQYIGKYMTKGVSFVSKLVELGWAGWLPSSWYSLSRKSLVNLRSKIIQRPGLSEMLMEMVEIGSSDVVWKHTFCVEFDDGRKVPMAVMGCVKTSVYERQLPR